MTITLTHAPPGPCRPRYERAPAAPEPSHAWALPAPGDDHDRRVESLCVGESR